MGRVLRGVGLGTGQTVSEMIWMLKLVIVYIDPSLG